MPHTTVSPDGRDGSALAFRRSAARCGVLFTLALALAGCGAVRSQATNVGTDVVGALREKEPELFEIERRLADSMGTYLGRAVDDKVLTRASGVWDTMLLKMNEQSGALTGRLAQGVERDLSRSLQVLLSENLDLANREGGRLVDTVFARARAGLGPLFDELKAGIEDELRPVLIRVIGEAADSVALRIDSLDRRLAGSKTVGRVSQLVYVVIGGLIIMIIGGGIVWRRDRVRTRQAFKVAMASTPPVQRDAVQAQLRGKGFGRQADWLE